jgi:hypothetical protein
MQTIKLSKQQWETIGKTAKWMKTAEEYLVVNNEFNRANYPDMIGKSFDSPPAYAQVTTIKNLNKWIAQASDLLSQAEKIMRTAALDDMAVKIQKVNNELLANKQE